MCAPTTPMPCAICGGLASVHFLTDGVRVASACYDHYDAVENPGVCAAPNLPANEIPYPLGSCGLGAARAIRPRMMPSKEADAWRYGWGD